MPFQVTFFQLPCGVRAARTDMWDLLTGEDASRIVAMTDPGGELYGMPFLWVTKKLDALTPEARSLFSRRGTAWEQDSWSAVVVTNPLIRVTANFILRIQRARRTRLFSAEPEAVSWLDDQTRRDVAAKRAG